LTKRKPQIDAAGSQCEEQPLKKKTKKQKQEELA